MYYYVFNWRLGGIAIYSVISNNGSREVSVLCWLMSTQSLTILHTLDGQVEPQGKLQGPENDVGDHYVIHVRHPII